MTTDRIARRRARGQALVRIVTSGFAVAGLVSVGVVPRLRHSNELSDAAEVTSAQAPRVLVVRAAAARAETRLELPGDAQPLRETSIHAQVGGYLAALHVDIGARVDSGALLAEIDTPLLDQELKEAQARLLEAQASLSEARANVELARTTFVRFKDAAERGGVARQELDERRASFERMQASVEARLAAVESSKATIGRIEEQKKFARVTAPFGGTITRRTLDLGALIKGSDTGSGQELFRLAETSVLRVFVNVPQTYALGVREGQEARLSFSELPGQSFPGRVTRTAGALERGSRTLLTEIRVENGEGRLLPGMFTHVSLAVTRASAAVVIPANALVTSAAGPRVAVVTADSRLHYQPVSLGRDLGRQVEITDGLEPGAALVANLADEIPEGTLVDAAPLTVMR